MSQQPQQQKITGTTGEMTGVSLQDTDCLFMPCGTDSFGMQRRALTEDGLKLSLELARMAYTLDIEPWMHAGWMDFSVQVDNQLTTGLKAREDDSLGSRVQSALGSLRLSRARRAMREHNNPLAQVTGALRQREESDTIKAVIMLRPAQEGRYVLAIGFMGTGTRFYDWFSNFRVGMEHGFHKGFYQLTQEFIKNEAEIVFPDTAEALGLETLTLRDILAEMRGEDSRFSLWMAGHSQGAAVMQVYASYLLENRKLNSRYLFGCGFASPTVAAGSHVPESAEYPLYHVLNTEDLIPRMGSMKHFGFCLQYAPDAAFRDAAYDWSMEEADILARKDAQRLTLHITNTLSFLSAFTALLQVICEEKSDETIFGGSEGIFSIAPVEKVFSFAGRKAKDSLHSMIVYMRKTYTEIRGRDMDEAAIAFMMERFRPIVQSMPLKRLLAALYGQLYPPHSLCRSNTMNGAYMRIVKEHSSELTQFVWLDDGSNQPHRCYARGYYAYGQQIRKHSRKGLQRRRRWRRRRAIQMP